MNRALVVGGLVLGGGAAVALAYVLTRPKSGGSSTTPTPRGGGGGGGGGVKSSEPADLDALLTDVVATRSGPDYDFVLEYGGWTFDRERQYSFPALGPGSIVRIRMYPNETGFHGPRYDYALQITRAIPVGSFALYQGRWVNTPGGLDPNELVTITSADINSVIKAIGRNA